MAALKTLQRLAKQHGTPLFVVDHDVLRRNYATFRKYLPRVQAYYAVKANPDAAIVKTLYEAGASFDVASMPESIVHECIRTCRPTAAGLIWDKLIYANPIKANETLQELDTYKALVTYDNAEKSGKSEIRRTRVRPAPESRQHRRWSNSSKFGASSGER